MWRSLLLVSIVLTLASNARADEERDWIPPPRHQSDSGKAYIGAGLTVFGLAYLPSLTVGGLSVLGNTLDVMFDGRTTAGLSWHVIPVFGPLVYAVNPSRDSVWHVRTEDETRDARFQSLAGGLVQMAGLALFAYGVASSKHLPRGPQPRAPRFTPNGLGFALTMEL